MLGQESRQIGDGGRGVGGVAQHDGGGDAVDVRAAFPAVGEVPAVFQAGDPDHETYRWNVHDDRRRDFWGNAVIESWFREATPVLDLDGKPLPVSDAMLDDSAVQVGADGLG